MLRKLTSICLVISLLFVTGCDQTQSDTGKETSGDVEQNAGNSTVKNESTVDPAIIPEETVVLDVYSQLTNYQGEQQGWFAQEMLERFNVKLNFIYDGSDDFYSRMAESGDLGDIVIFGTDTDQYHSAIEEGLLLDWETDSLLQNYGSDILELMPDAIEKNRSKCDGHVFGFGYDVAYESGEYGDFDYHPDIRWDLYQQIGSPKVVELEDYVDVLKKMKEICPTSDSGQETYGVSLFSDWDGDMMMFAKSTCTNFFGVDELGIGLYNAADGTFQGALEDDGYYIRVLHFYNELYRNDLLDPESQTQGYSGCIEDYQDGRAFFCIFSWMAAPQYNTVEHTADNKIMLPLAAENQNTLVYGLNKNGGNRVWAIGSQTEYPELVMAIINWLCTPEGYLVFNYGPKGVCWDYDLNKNTCILDFGYKVKNGDVLEMPEDSGYTGTWQDGTPQLNNTTWTINTTNPESNGQTYNYQYWPNVLSITVSDIEQEWRDTYNVSSIREYLSGFNYTVSKPNTYSASSKSEELGTKWGNVTSCIREGSWSAVFAETEEEFWTIIADMQQKANEAGYEDCVAWCENEAQLRKASEE